VLTVLTAAFDSKDFCLLLDVAKISVSEGCNVA